MEHVWCIGNSASTCVCMWCIFKEFSCIYYHMLRLRCKSTVKLTRFWTGACFVYTFDLFVCRSMMAFASIVYCVGNTIGQFLFSPSSGYSIYMLLGRPLRSLIGKYVWVGCGGGAHEFPQNLNWDILYCRCPKIYFTVAKDLPVCKQTYFWEFYKTSL